MNKEVFQLIYLSSANYEFSQEELLQILEKSRKNNTALNITGILLYEERNIIQLLEGDRKRVESLFKVIQNDQRHSGIICLIRDFKEKRDFPEWSMGFQRLKHGKFESELVGFNKLVEKKSIIDEDMKNLSSAVKVLIKSFTRSIRS